MDRSWMSAERTSDTFIEGLVQFMKFARKKGRQYGADRFKCPCSRCCNIRVYPMKTICTHILRKGFLSTYTVWTEHGEVREVGESSSNRDRSAQHLPPPNSNVDPVQQAVDAVDPSRDVRLERNDEEISSRETMTEFKRLVTELQTPLYENSADTTLAAMLRILSIKQKTGMTNTTFDDVAAEISSTLPQPNAYVSSYAEARQKFKAIEMPCVEYDACYYGCTLYYGEYSKDEDCHVCGESRYENVGSSQVARKTLWYFSVTDRLKRLFMAPETAEWMRWHGERERKDDDTLAHPSDGEDWIVFDTTYPEFSSEIRNVRLAVAADGFCPFGANAPPYSLWPVFVVPLNFPPLMVMRKEYNMLTMLISGPKSPGKCLNNFMRPLIDELKQLWHDGVVTWDEFKNETFLMRAAVMWTISDYPGLGLLGGIHTKRYKACPICTDSIDATHSRGRTTYQGARRYLDINHELRRMSHAFNGTEDRRPPPPVLSGSQVLGAIEKYDYPYLSLHPKLKHRADCSFCWTHRSIFWELEYWTTHHVRHALDVMHIEKNVCDNVIGTVLGVTGKTKDDEIGRFILQDQNVRPELWLKHDRDGKWFLPQADYVVKPSDREEVHDHITSVRYPSGYAESLQNRLKGDNMFNGLKNHDCHVLIQRIFPIVIRKFVTKPVADALVELGSFFQMLCARELKKSDLKKMKKDIVLLQCKLESIFPPSFFTIMVHLCLHIPDQVLRTGPVHFTWMFPIERQLGEYKRSVRNMQYPEECIAQQYLMHESVTFTRMYLNRTTSSTKGTSTPTRDHKLSVVSKAIEVRSVVQGAAQLTSSEMFWAHWTVIENCVELDPWVESHLQQFQQHRPNGTNQDRVMSFNYNFKRCMKLPGYQREFVLLSRMPRSSAIYSECIVNAVKFVCVRVDEKRKNQNSGVMIEANNTRYFGVLVDICVLTYEDNMSVVIFKCRWYDERKLKNDRGLTSINTRTDRDKENPFCLAIKAKQVFYVDDPRMGCGWKVVNFMPERDSYKSSTLAHTLDNSPVYEVSEPYQEPNIDTLVTFRPGEITIDFGDLPRFVPSIQPATLDHEDQVDDTSCSENSDMEGHEDYVDDDSGN